MRQFIKFIGYFLLGLLIVIIGILAYFQLGNNKGLSPLSIVPDDAILIVESNNFSESLVTITETNYWKSIIESDALSEVKKGMIAFENSLENNKWLRSIFKNQRVSFSFHQVSQTKTDYLFVTDIRKYGKLNMIPKLVNILEWPMKEYDVDSTKLYSVYIKSLDRTIHLATIENLLIGSTTYKLLENTIKQYHHPKPETNFDKNKQVLKAFNNAEFNIYTNLKKLQDFLLAKNSYSFFNGLAFTALGGDITENSFELNGYTNSYENIPSPFLALKNTKPGNRDTEKVIPSDVLFYCDFNVQDFISFHNDFLTQYAKLDPIGHTTYVGGLKITESYLGINIQDDIFSWLTGEISMAKLKPIANVRENDFIVVVKASDIAKAKSSLNSISKKIKNRTSFKFNNITYNNHVINHLNIRGFFKIFMGSLLNNREKPYYTIIDDCIVFSNSSDILQYTIDNYLIGNTLKRNQDFQDFMDLFSDKSQFTAYLNMHNLYEHLYVYSHSLEKASYRKQRKIIQNIGWLGFQLTPENDLLKTKILSQSVEGKEVDANLLNQINSAENLYLNEFENLEFKIKLENKYIDSTGYVYIHTLNRVNDSILNYEGYLENGLMNELWRSYYDSGNIKSAVNYNDGQTDGTAIFYFDNTKHIIRAEIDFNNDIIDGSYKEFYSNGNIKAHIEFNDGVRWGNAVFYYRNGKIKIEGQYKKGKRAGKWNYYSKAAELINKESW